MILSVIALWVTGLLLLIAVIYVIYALSTKTGEPLTKYEIAMLLISLTIAVALSTVAFSFAEASLGLSLFEKSASFDFGNVQKNIAQGYNSLLGKTTTA